ncbi:hypothetical protein D3C75_1083540 [compost metagenome]
MQGKLSRITHGLQHLADILLPGIIRQHIQNIGPQLQLHIRLELLRQAVGHRIDIPFNQSHFSSSSFNNMASWLLICIHSSFSLS